MQQVSFIETSATNTPEEINSAVHECISRIIQKLTLISSPTHIARCQQEACKLREQRAGLMIKFYVRLSDTCFANSTAQDVTIIEPPHRSERLHEPFNKTLKDIFLVSRNSTIASVFHEALAHLIEEYKEKLRKEE